MPTKTSKKKIPKHVIKTMKALMKALVRLGKRYDVNLLVMLETNKHFEHKATGPIMNSFEGRIEELHDVVLEGL